MRDLLGVFVFLLVVALTACGDSAAVTEDSRTPEEVLGRQLNDLERPLVEACWTADSISIETTGFWDNQPRFMALKGNNVVRDFLGMLEVQRDSGGECMCEGEIWLRFIRGDRQILKLSYQHGSALRWWNGSWSGDCYMSDRCETSLPKWFAERGCKWFEEVYGYNNAEEPDEYLKSIGKTWE